MPETCLLVILNVPKNGFCINKILNDYPPAPEKLPGPIAIGKDHLPTIFSGSSWLNFGRVWIFIHPHLRNPVFWKFPTTKNPRIYNIPCPTWPLSFDHHAHCGTAPRYRVFSWATPRGTKVVFVICKHAIEEKTPQQTKRLQKRLKMCFWCW